MITERLEAAVAALEALPAPTPPDTTAATVAEQDAVAARLEAVKAKQAPPTP